MVSQNGNIGELVRVVSPAQYKEIDSFKAAMQLALELEGVGTEAELLAASELGDGFALVDKGSLIGMKMVILSVMLKTGDLGEYAIVRAVTKNNQKVVVVDGSTGIKDQLAEYMQDTGGKFPRLWENGLRVSEYTYDGENGPTPAKTYYINTSA